MTIYEALAQYIKSKDGQKVINNEQSIKPDLVAFLKKYPVSKIEKLTLEEYCEGYPAKDGFCYTIEWGKGIKEYGSIRNARVWKYNLKFDKSAQKPVAYRIGTATITRDSNEINEIFSKTKAAIIETIDSLSEVHQGNLSRFTHASTIINSTFQNKIAFLYDSENEIPIYSSPHLGIILNDLGYSLTSLDTVWLRRDALFKFYKTAIKPQYPEVTPYVFMCFLYSYYSPEFKKLKNGGKSGDVFEDAVTDKSDIEIDNQIAETTKLDTEGINDKWKIKIVSDLPEAPKASHKKHGGKGNPSPVVPKQDELIKRGEAGEDYIFGYLKNLEDQGLIDSLENVSKIRSEGCDFKFLHDGNLVRVDAKVTKSNLGNTIQFFMTSTEMRKLKEDPNHYYIFFVSGFREGCFFPEIQIVRAESILAHREQTSWLINFEANDTE